MRKLLPALAAVAAAANGETYTLTMKQAVDRALLQNPEVEMARLDEARATQSVRLSKEPFYPKVGAGSGLAYTYGIPLSVNGSAPSAVQVQANASLFNKPQRIAIEQARETARGAGFAVGQKRDEIAYRVASLYLDVDRAGRQMDTVRKQVESMRKVVDTVSARIAEGRELPNAEKLARFDVMRMEQRLDDLESTRDSAERTLAVALGYTPRDAVRPADADRPLPAIPDTEAAAVQAALAQSPELKRLQSNMTAKGLEIQSNEAKRLPQVDLVAQYALNANFNNYSKYYQNYQTHNAELGASIQIPLFGGESIRAANAPAMTEQRKLRTELQMTRDRIELDLHQSYLEVKKADRARALAQEDLSLTRDQLTVVLSQLDEGRATLREVEQARFAESEKWLAFYDARFGLEKARLDVLRQTGELAAAVR